MWNRVINPIPDYYFFLVNSGENTDTSVSWKILALFFVLRLESRTYQRSSRYLIALSSFQCCVCFNQNLSYSFTERRNSPIWHVSLSQKDSVRLVRIAERVKTAKANGNSNKRANRSYFWSALSRMNALLPICWKLKVQINFGRMNNPYRIGLWIFFGMITREVVTILCTQIRRSII